MSAPTRLEPLHFWVCRWASEPQLQAGGSCATDWAWQTQSRACVCKEHLHEASELGAGPPALLVTGCGCPILPLSQVRDAARGLLSMLARRAWGRESRYR